MAAADESAELPPPLQQHLVSLLAGLLSLLSLLFQGLVSLLRFILYPIYLFCYELSSFFFLTPSQYAFGISLRLAPVVGFFLAAAFMGLLAGGLAAWISEEVARYFAASSAPPDGAVTDDAAQDESPESEDPIGKLRRDTFGTEDWESEYGPHSRSASFRARMDSIQSEHWEDFASVQSEAGAFFERLRQSSSANTSAAGAPEEELTVEEMEEMERRMEQKKSAMRHREGYPLEQES